MSSETRRRPLPEDLRALAASGRHDDAIAALEAGLRERPLGLAMRLRLADLLVGAGRGVEAVPIFLTLADELERRRRPARAIALLKRIESIEPEREDVSERIDRLLREELRTTATGITPTEPMAPEAIASAVAEGAAEAEDAPGAASEVLMPSLAGRIRGAFRRFLAGLPGPGEAAPEAQPSALPAEPAPHAKGEAALAAPEVSAGDLPEEANREAGLEVEPAPAAATPSDSAPEPSAAEADPLDILRAGQEAPPEPTEAWDTDALVPAGEAPPPPPGLSSRMLEMLAQTLPATPLPAEDIAEDEAPVRTRGVAESVRRLSETPLLGGLAEAELIAVVRAMRLRVLEPGEIAVTEGEPGHSLFVIMDGRLRVFVRNPSGRSFGAGELGAGDFFGEIGSLSGRARSATIVAAQRSELLELDKGAVDRIARTHPRVREALEAAYIRRASSPEAAAIRAVAVDAESRDRAIEVLEAYFGESRWEPRMRLRLADLLVRTGKEDEAVPLLVGLAAEMDRAGYPEKAVAILKKIEGIKRRNVEEVNLAPLRKGPEAHGLRTRAESQPSTLSPEVARSLRAEAAAPRPGWRGKSQDRLESWILDMARHAAGVEGEREAESRGAPVGYASGLRASPLFEGFDEGALADLIRELRLVSASAGDVILTEGEPGHSLFVIAAGAVRVYVKGEDGKSRKVADLPSGSFFGEIAALSGRPRTATVTAAAATDLLEIDRPALDALSAKHPRVREIIEEHYIARAARAGGAAH